MATRRHASVWPVMVSVLVTAILTGVVRAPAQASPGPPGAVVAIAPLGRAWGGLDRVARLSYLTTDGFGHTVPASGLVRTPAGTPPPGGWPVVVWTHGTSGLGPDCGLTASPIAERNDSAIVAEFNRAGYAVVAPEYLGLSPAAVVAGQRTHPYLQTRSEATASADIVRAAHIALPGLSRRWAVVGVSQGGHAALATGNVASARAPDLDFRGTVAMAPASNVENAILALRPGVPALPAGLTGTVAAILAGMAANSDDVDVGRYLTPLGRGIIDRISSVCAPDFASVVGQAPAGRLVSRPLDDPVFAAALHRYMAVPTTGYDRPILVVQGFRDADVPLPLTAALLGEFAAAGTRYELRVVDSDHGDLPWRGGLDAATEFLGRVMDNSVMDNN